MSLLKKIGAGIALAVGLAGSNLRADDEGALGTMLNAYGQQKGVPAASVLGQHMQQRSLEREKKTDDVNVNVNNNYQAPQGNVNTPQPVFFNGEWYVPLNSVSTINPDNIFRPYKREANLSYELDVGEKSSSNEKEFFVRNKDSFKRGETIYILSSQNLTYSADLYLIDDAAKYPARKTHYEGDGRKDKKRFEGALRWKIDTMHLLPGKYHVTKDFGCNADLKSFEGMEIGRTIIVK